MRPVVAAREQVERAASVDRYGYCDNNKSTMNSGGWEAIVGCAGVVTVRRKSVCSVLTSPIVPATHRRKRLARPR